MKRCPNCNQEVDAAVKFCRRCGTQLMSDEEFGKATTKTLNLPAADTRRMAELPSNIQALENEDKALSEPDFKFSGPAPASTSDLDYEPDETVTKILVFILKHPHVYVVEIENVLKLSQTRVKSYLDKLEEDGYVIVTRDSRTDSDVCNITQKGKKFLDKPVRTIPFPSGHDELDPSKIKILQLLADETCPPFIDSLSIALEMHHVRLKEHLDVLVERGWLTANEFDEWYAVKYRLTRRANQFLINNNLIK